MDEKRKKELKELVKDFDSALDDLCASYELMEAVIKDLKEVLDDE